MAIEKINCLTNGRTGFARGAQGIACLIKHNGRYVSAPVRSIIVSVTKCFYKMNRRVIALPKP